MSSVGINPPKTPVTKGCMSVAKATVPNVCKMPGPPAPFVPAPLPNIAKSGMSPKGYSKKVKIEGNTVAIRGASYKSMGDVASKGTGGGLISANTHGPAKFITPGSLNVKIEGKSVHLLGEPMLNNCGASGSPPNTGATMSGTKHSKTKEPDIPEVKPNCQEKRDKKGWDDCQCGQVCEMVKAYNNSGSPKERLSPSPSRAPPGSPERKAYTASITSFENSFAETLAEHGPDSQEVKDMFYNPGPPAEPDCQHKKWKKEGSKAKPDRSTKSGCKTPMSPDHMHPAVFKGPLTKENLKWADSNVNYVVGGSMKKKSLDPAPKKLKAHESCKCE